MKTRKIENYGKQHTNLPILVHGIRVPLVWNRFHALINSTACHNSLSQFKFSIRFTHWLKLKGLITMVDIDIPSSRMALMKKSELLVEHSAVLLAVLCDCSVSACDIQNQYGWRESVEIRQNVSLTVHVWNVFAKYVKLILFYSPILLARLYQPHTYILGQERKVQCTSTCRKRVAYRLCAYLQRTVTRLIKNFEGMHTICFRLFCLRQCNILICASRCSGGGRGERGVQASVNEFTH